MAYKKVWCKGSKATVTFKGNGSFKAGGLYCLGSASNFSLPNFGECAPSREGEIDRIKAIMSKNNK